MIAAAALRIAFGMKRGGPSLRAEARAYMRVRRAYEKAGFTVRAHDAPLAFAAQLRSMHAPGLEHVEQVVELYLKARFSAQVMNAAERSALAASEQAALRALRSRPMDRSKRAAAA